jgi:hypothetical protein
MAELRWEVHMSGIKILSPNENVIDVQKLHTLSVARQLKRVPGG